MRVASAGLSGQYIEELKDIYFSHGNKSLRMTIPSAATTADAGSTYGYASLTNHVCPSPQKEPT